VPAVLIISGAGAFGRNHGCAERVLRRAGASEGRAIDGLFQSLQHLGTDALGWFVHRHLRQLEHLFGVVRGELRPQPQAACGDGAHAPPLAVADFKDLGHDALCRQIPCVADGAHLLVFDLGASGFELGDEHRDGFEQIERFESAHHDGHAEFSAQHLVFALAHDRADVARGDETLDAGGGRTEQQANGRGNKHLRHQHREILEPFAPGLPDGHGIGGSGSLKADGEEHHVALRVLMRDL